MRLFDDPVECMGASTHAVLSRRRAQMPRVSLSSATPTSPVDQIVFAKCGYDVPTSASEARTLTEDILQEERSILKASSKDSICPAEAETETLVPSTHVIKANLHIDGIQSFGKWQILTSSRALRDLRRARREDAKKFEIIVKKIRELSRGHFSDDNHKRLSGPDVGIPIYEAKMSRDLRLVVRQTWTLHESAGQKQAIRVFGVYTHAQLERRFWDAVSRTLEDKDLEYHKRQVPPRSSSRRQYRDRATYRRGDNVVTPGRFPAQTEEDAAPMTTGLDKEQIQELRIWAEQDVAHVFDVSTREQEVIDYTSSCIVIGTGAAKTTTMMFKMLGIEQAWKALDDGTPKPRQLFVTQSRVLAEKVEEYYGKLLQSFDLAQRSHAELKTIATSQATARHERLVNYDEEVYWRNDLPKRYGALTSDHFPMFLTFDHLCRLLESEFQHMDAEAEKENGTRRALQQVSRRQGRHTQVSSERGKILDYGTFLGTYWSHLTLYKGLGKYPALVFSEFLGVIQGSEEALNSEHGYLDEDSYQRRRSSVAMSTAQRESIYASYLRYRKMKRQLCHRDAADRAFELVRLLKEKGLPGLPVDFLYVDEAQDNLLVDTFILRTLCPNVNGMFWAGDTAQTISAGSAFKFSELKAFLYRLSQNPVSATAKAAPSNPEVFHLTINYRSHQGIVKCAASIVDLMTRHWSSTVDPLPAEEGTMPGPKPIFFQNVDCEQFLIEDSGSAIEFGAHQCILVLNDAAKERLRSRVGKAGIILTIQESKGLEFDDVLLYDPFADSTVDDRAWRIVLTDVAGEIAPTFDETRHNGICRELKFLYVAVTRTRMNLWIVDSSRGQHPMLRFWRNADVVEEHNPFAPIPRLAVSSSREEWAGVARKLFHKQQFFEAELAFDRAGLAKERRVAHAYYLRDLAHTTSPSGVRTDGRPSSRYVRAADAFLQSAQEASDVDDQQSYYRIAGDCYAKGRQDRAAAEAFYAARDYNNAAKHYRAAGMFDDALNVVKDHQRDVERSVADGIVAVAKLQFLRENEVQKACTLFDSEDEALEYMASYGLETSRATLLESLGRLAEAAECRLVDGQVLEAVQLLLRDHRNPASISRAKDVVLAGLWTHFTFRNPKIGPRPSPKTSDVVQDLLHTATKLRKLQLDMFEAISQHNAARLFQLSHRFSQLSNLAAELVCLDHLFAKLPELQSTFLRYSRILQHLACAPDPCESEPLQKLFSFSKLDEEHYYLSVDSILFAQLVQDHVDVRRNVHGWEGISVPQWELEKTVKKFLRKRLGDVVTEENELCHNLRSIQPCLPFIAIGHCPRYNCANHHPVAGEILDAYNALVRIHVLQIMIYHQLYASNIDSGELFKQQRAWLRRLYEALYPAHFKLGSIHTLKATLIPELTEGQSIITVWVRDFLSQLCPGRDRQPSLPFLSGLIRVTRIAMLFDSRVASNDMHRIPCMNPGPHWRVSSLWRNQTYVVHDLMSMVQGKHPHALDHGMLFLHHVVQRRLPIDITVLCDLMDNLCGCLVAAMRFRTGAKLHDVTLPKSWILRIVRDDRILRNQSVDLWKDYHRCFATLLQQVCTGRGASYLLLANRTLEDPGNNVTRNILVARICRNLCLWGLNCRSLSVQQDVAKFISSIGQPNPASSLIAPYVYAKSWGELIRAVCASTSGSDLDEMIRLCHNAEPTRGGEFPHVRRVVFSRQDRILAALSIEEPSPFASDQMHATSVPGPMSPSQQTPDPPTLQPSEPEPAVSLQNDPAVDVGEHEGAHLSALELQAAIKIAKVFQQYRERTQAKRDALDEKRRRISSYLRAQAQSLSWTSSLARLLFLGAMPHVYLSIECTLNLLDEAATRTKERLKVVDHQELEEVQSALDCLSGLARRDHSRRSHKACTPLGCV
ncbi:hypothetical protein C8Q70DRAFT_1046658 [Cubamyces menziesii]|nr:hypothetical protein C8Q70DRAFT_1046658 [Cubamyces menziesii]